ncbi:type II toxin-antitoxin system RelE family toxin [Kyrpidia spormannii]|uniref:type II toxin-antitoxin system RelE family toxin n=1 Tax=Kyrpidia spormannii TaxID=2055160 RepID=UPI001E5AEDBF|nr:hypothetical protein [Kyrpidia spormannii]
MSEWRVIVSREAAATLRRLDRKQKERTIRAIDRTAKDPTPGPEKISAPSKECPASGGCVWVTGALFSRSAPRNGSLRLWLFVRGEKPTDGQQTILDGIFPTTDKVTQSFIELMCEVFGYNKFRDKRCCSPQGGWQVKKGGGGLAEWPCQFSASSIGGRVVPVVRVAVFLDRVGG